MSEVQCGARAFGLRAVWIAGAAVGAGALWLGGGSARGNPVTLDKVVVRQVPHTTHVQITYGIDTGADVPEPAAVSRDGRDIRVAWTAYDGYQSNTGSGLVSLKSWQACDCDVPVGDHSYVVTPSGQPASYPVTVTVVTNLDDPPDAGPVDPDAMPWDIPDPVDLQGIDCVQVCAAGPPPDDGDKDSGCATVSASAATGLGTLALFALVLLGLTFRKRIR